MKFTNDKIFETTSVKAETVFKLAVLREAQILCWWLSFLQRKQNGPLVIHLLKRYDNDNCSNCNRMVAFNISYQTQKKISYHFDDCRAINCSCIKYI